MVFMQVVFFFPSTPDTDVQNMNYTVVVTGGVMLLSVAYYYFPKYGGVHWFRGPVANVDIQSSRQSMLSEQPDKGDNKGDQIETGL